MAPVAFVIALSLIALSPVLVLAAFVADMFLPGSWRTVRLTAFLVWYTVCQAIGLVVMVSLWIAGGFGLWMRRPAMQTAHYAFMRWFLRQINGAARTLFKMRIRIEDAPLPQAGPILVFSRHAGPGNSLMLVGTLMIGYKRRPRVVMLAKLQWEPLFDVMGNRIPNRFIQHDRNRREAQITAIGSLARGLGDRDAFVLFPEGHDFTPKLRMKAIASLRRKGHAEEAEQAEQMPYVLPPRYGGVGAAIQAAPEADVVFVAHTVLEDVGSFDDLWSRIPLKEPIGSRFWRIPAREVPGDPEELKRWLFGWWREIDRWIQGNLGFTGPVPAPATVEREVELVEQEERRLEAEETPAAPAEVPGARRVG